MDNGAGGKQNEKITVRVDAELQSIVPGFLKNRQKDLISIREALKRADFQRISVLGHCMKGSGGGYGFDGITEIGGSLERAANEQNTNEVQRQIECLGIYLERIEVVYV
ncbi:MAG TPA: Hpt domain-containing protein [Acidobacteriota bacterium]|jgi:HPt (histidine-containing phosphotransfer) domain-containing protein